MPLFSSIGKMDWAVLMIAGIVAGICNATSGGGTLFTFPVFLALGVNPVIANTSNAVSVWPGHALAAFGYRENIKNSNFVRISWILMCISGSIAGSYMLLKTSNEAFKKLIPFLIALATLLFTFGKKLRDYVSTCSFFNNNKKYIITNLLIFVFSAYGGFFGAGLGVMMMALLVFLGVDDIQENNAIKNLLASIVTTLSVAVFIFNNSISLYHVVPTFAGCWFGGVLGVKIAKHLDAVYLRNLVIGVGVTLTCYYGYKFF